MSAPHKYRVFARELGTVAVTAHTHKHAVAIALLRFADLGLMHERDADKVLRWCVQSIDPIPISESNKNTESKNTKGQSK